MIGKDMESAFASKLILRKAHSLFFACSCIFLRKIQSKIKADGFINEPSAFISACAFLRMCRRSESNRYDVATTGF